MVNETSKSQNVETSNPVGPDDYQLPIANPRIAAIWRALETVTDPEIPVISVIDMGIIADVRVADRRVAVDMTPTFVGCPALDMIRDNIASALRAAGEVEVQVNVVFDPPWSSERITQEGRRKLKAFGLAPPVRACGAASAVPSLERIECPYCDSTNTDVESIFGPTLCRSIHYCRDCLQSFEHFKPV